MDTGLKGKSVIVTGGASNIGRAIVLAFAEEGSHITLADIDEPQARKVAREAEAKGTGARVQVVRCDVTDYAQVEQMVRKAIDAFGGVDVLVNNVGWTVDRLFLEKPYEEWEKEVRINLWSVIHCCRAVLPHMVERGKGVVISVSSDAGKMGEYREAVYAACKAGVIALMKALAREVGRYGIRLNAVCPGLTVPQSEEEMGEQSMWRRNLQLFTPEALEKAKRAYPLRRLGTAREVADAVVFLASDRASFITGQALSVSGGYTMMG